MFSQSDLIVNSIVPLILIVVSVGSVILESFFPDKKFISPWLSVVTCIICTIVLIFIHATLADLLIYLVAVLCARLIVTHMKGGKKNDI